MSAINQPSCQPQSIAGISFGQGREESGHSARHFFTLLIVFAAVQNEGLSWFLLLAEHERGRTTSLNRTDTILGLLDLGLQGAKVARDAA